MEAKKEKKSISYRTSNRVYLWVVILIMVSIIPAGILIYVVMPGVSEEVIESVLIEIYLLAPIVAVFSCREKPNEILGFHKFRLSSVLWILLMIVLLEPMTQFLASITTFIEPGVGDEVPTLQTAIPIFITSCILPGFSEEFLCRGVMFSGYKKSCSFLTAAILSSVCFGLLHANFYQMFYAMVGGFFYALLLQATGSLWATMLAHTLDNAFAYFLWPRLFGYFFPGNGLGYDAGTPTAGILIGFAIAALIMTPLALLVIKKIAKREGRENPLDLLRGSNKKQGERNHFITPALIIAFLILILETIMNLIMDR